MENRITETEEVNKFTGQQVKNLKQFNGSRICHVCSKSGASIRHNEIIWTHSGECLAKYNRNERKAEEL